MAEEKKTSKKAEKVEKTEKAPKKKSKKNPFKSIASFFKSVKSEGKKVTWAKPKDVFKNTIVVLIVCIIAGLCIFLVDTGLSKGMEGIKKLSANRTTVSETADADTTADANADLVADADGAETSEKNAE